MRTHRVPVLVQSTMSLCWEACARMMWSWRHRGLRGYQRRAGRTLEIQAGLSEAQMDTFYRRLGMRSLRNPRPANLQHALNWSPVIFTSMNPQSGHALLATGYTGAAYLVANPCAVQVIDFGSESGSCQAGSGPIPAPTVESHLGTFIWYW